MEQNFNQYYDQAVSKLTERLNSTYKEMAVFLAISIVFMVVILICALASWNKVSRAANVVSIVGLVVCILAEVAFLPMLINFRADKILADQGEFVVFEGELVDFDFEYTVNRSSYYKSRPKLQSTDGETVVFNISDAENRMEIGSTYKVVYLPNTGCAEIIEGE